MLSYLRTKHRLKKVKNVYVLVDDRKHEPDFYAFSSWDKICKKAAELIMDAKAAYPEELRKKLEELFIKDKYEEVLYLWREGYGWGVGVYLRTEVLALDGKIIDT